MRRNGKNEQEKSARAFDAEIERLKTAPEYSQLEQGNCSSGKLAAKNIRKELQQFKSVKFSVRNRHYGSVDVNWTDGPTLEKVKAIINKYKDGYFNSMQDIYEYSASPFNAVFGSAQYPSAQRSYSDAMIGKAIDKIISAYDLKFEIEPTAEDFRTGKLWSEKRVKFSIMGYSRKYTRLWQVWNKREGRCFIALRNLVRAGKMRTALSGSHFIPRPPR